jgi:hypothetical protein
MARSSVESEKQDTMRMKTVVRKKSEDHDRELSFG